MRMFRTFATDPTGGFTDYLFTQGVLGVVLAGLLLAFIYHYRTSQKRLDDKDVQIAVLNKQILELTDARRLDFKDTTNEVIDVLRDNSQNLRILSEKIEVGKAIDRNRV